MEFILFSLIPLSSIALMFVKDAKKERNELLNMLLIANAVFFLSPIFMAYSNTPSGESMWNENTGGGAVLWYYIIIIPISTIVQLVLAILKFIFASNSNSK